MSLLTNPLFGAVAFLVGTLVGLLAGRWSRGREWDKREQLMKETFKATQGTAPGCWVKAQIDANDNSG